MKKIDTTNIAGLAKAPFIKATHDHIKESIQESTSNIVKGLIGSYTTNDLIVLYGCVVTATIPGTSSITAGAIYYNGEIYEVDANASLITTGVQTLVWGVSTTYIAADLSLTWSDGTIRNLHQIDKLALSAGASGSGLANYNGATVKTLVQATAGTWTALTFSNSYTGTAEYSLDKRGYVRFRGKITAPAVVASSLFTTLPDSVCPSTSLSVFAVIPQSSSFVPASYMFRLTIDGDNGQTTITELGGGNVVANAQISLDGLIYPVY